MRSSLFVTFSLLMATAAVGQTQLVRGDIADVPGTNQFLLDCTNIQLVSSTVNLQQLHEQSRGQNIDYAMQVTDVSGNGTVLNVVTASVIPEVLNMGNLRFGRTETWEVLGTPGSLVGVWVTARALTSYLPVGSLGTWLLGANTLLVRQGQIGGGGQLQFGIQMPTLPALVGVDFTAQSVILDPSNQLTITHPDCKTVRSN